MAIKVSIWCEITDYIVCVKNRQKQHTTNYSTHLLIAQKGKGKQRATHTLCVRHELTEANVLGNLSEMSPMLPLETVAMLI